MPPERALFVPPPAIDAKVAEAPAADPRAAEAARVLDDARRTIASLEARLLESDGLAEELRVAARCAEEREADARADADQRIAEVAERTAAVAAAIEERLVTLAFAIARKVVGRELASAPELLVAWAREALAASGLAGASVVAPPAARDAFAGWTETPVDFDAELAGGTCELRTDTQTVEVSADARVDTVAEQVGAPRVREAA